MGSNPFKDDGVIIMHVAVMSVFSFLAISAVVLRLWARKIKRNVWESNDYLIIVGLAWTLGLSGYSMHPSMYAMLVGQITWAVSVFFIRASILALYIRIFRTPSFRIACYVIHGFNSAFFVSVVLAALLICRPISFNWDHNIPGGVCGDQKSLDQYAGVFNLFMDVAVVVLPMPVLWGLQMARSKKVMLSGMFGLGIIICIITIVRIKITFDINGSNLKSSYSLLKLLADLEALLGVINACFPVMKPVFTKLAASNASNWLSSVMSGSIPMFIRPLKLGSNGKAAPSKAFAKGWSSSKQPIPKEMDRWSPNSSNSTPPISNLGQPPPPRCMDITPTDLVRPEPLRVSSRNSALRSPRPPVPDYSPARQREPAPMGDAAGFGIHVQNEWDIERGESHETDRDLLEDQR